jgi:hypothetical protein
MRGKGEYGIKKGGLFKKIKPREYYNIFLK